MRGMHPVWRRTDWYGGASERRDSCTASSTRQHPGLFGCFYGAILAYMSNGFLNFLNLQIFSNFLKFSKFQNSQRC